MTAPPAAHRYEVHTDDSYTVIVITEGQKYFRYGRGKFRAAVGDIVVVNPNESYACEPIDGQDWAHRTWFFETPLFGKLTSKLGKSKSTGFSGPIIRDLALSSHLTRVHAASENSEPLNEERDLVHGLSRLLMRYAGTITTKNNLSSNAASKERMEIYHKAISYDIASNVSLETLAKLSGVSRFQVIRDFQNVYAMSPGEYVRAMRLSIVKKLLRDGVTPAESALEVGFSDQSHLSRLFRRVYGITPKTYAKAFRQ